MTPLTKDYILQILDDVKNYIENSEVFESHEFGSSKTLDELIKDNEMPEVYEDLLHLISLFKCNT